MRCADPNAIADLLRALNAAPISFGLRRHLISQLAVGVGLVGDPAAAPAAILEMAGEAARAAAAELETAADAAPTVPWARGGESPPAPERPPAASAASTAEVAISIREITAEDRGTVQPAPPAPVRRRGEYRADLARFIARLNPRLLEGMLPADVARQYLEDHKKRRMDGKTVPQLPAASNRLTRITKQVEKIRREIRAREEASKV